MLELTERSRLFRSAIAAFIDARREAKLKGKEDDADALLKYDYSNWLADAARRCAAIQLATHPLKATYPDAKIKEATSLYVQGRELPKHLEVGTHNVEQVVIDATGDAASLGAFKFLSSVIVDGQAILHWILNLDADLVAALDDDPDRGRQLASDFKRIVRHGQPIASHFGAKQIYWCVGAGPVDDSQYHLLQPLFSSSLEDVVHTEIRAALWEEPNKSARKAKFGKVAFDTDYRDYKDLAKRNLGGTKPQNISQLNSERGGVNYLLASLPPTWDREHPRNLQNLDSALDRFAHFEGTRGLMKALSDFLLTDPDKVMETRQTREAFEQALGAHLVNFAASIWAQAEPGWTRDPACRLPQCEQLWLDPDRVDLPVREAHQAEDAAFNAAYTFGDWPDEVAGRFANWVNKRLRDVGLTSVGDAEYKHWAKQAIVDAASPVPMQRRAGGQL
jgi:CRISPR-associated protein Csy1